MKTSEAELIDHAVTEMRKQGVPVTPKHVERAVNAARPTVTVAEVVAGVNALCEKLDRQVADQDPNAGREVVGMYLSPRGPDGTYATNDEYGGVQKVIRTGAKPVQEFAETRPYFEAGNDALRTAPDHAPGSTPPGPTAPDELAALK